MLSLPWPPLASPLAVLSGLLAVSHLGSASVGLSAYAQRSGDLAAWQMCNLQPGFTVTFTPNPSRAMPNRHGIVADRTRLTVHVDSAVRPGLYPLIFISYSYVNGPKGQPLVEGFLVRLHVLFNHEVRLPAFRRWQWVFAPDPYNIAPPSTCTQLPEVRG